MREAWPAETTGHPAGAVRCQNHRAGRGAVQAVNLCGHRKLRRRYNSRGDSGAHWRHEATHSDRPLPPRLNMTTPIASFRRLFALALVCAWLLAPSMISGPAAFAQDPPAGDNDDTAKPANQLAVSTERVVVFKDYYGLIISRATATADANGMVFTDEIPENAALGCLWATFADGAAGSLAMRAD